MAISKKGFVKSVKDKLGKIGKSYKEYDAGLKDKYNAAVSENNLNKLRGKATKEAFSEYPSARTITNDALRRKRYAETESMVNSGKVADAYKKNKDLTVQFRKDNPNDPFETPAETKRRKKIK